MGTTSLRKALLSLAASGTFIFGTQVTNSAPAFAAGGQTGMLSGTVVDASNGAITNADIVLTAPSGRYTAHTDGRGKFRIMGADVDTYTFTIQKDGFLKMVEPGVAVMGDQTTDLGTITLQKA